jgi:hypothetical protein
MVANTSFTYRLVGTSGCEIVGPQGVIAWTVDELWAEMIVALLNGDEHRDRTDRRPA